MSCCWLTMKKRRKNQVLFRSGLAFVGLLVGASQAFGAYYFQITTSLPERLATYNGGGQFRGTLYQDSTQLGVYASQCVDFLNVVPQNFRYQVSVNSITQADMANTRWGSWDAQNNGTPGQANDFDTSLSRLPGANQYTAIERYMMSAWLMTQMQQFSSNPTSTGDANRNAIQDVIWELMNPAGSSPNPPLYTASGSLALVQSWWAQARTTGLGQDASFYAGFRIVTESPILNTPGTGSTTFQEQLIRVSTPEPADFALAISLGIVLYLCWRRRTAHA